MVEHKRVGGVQEVAGEEIVSITHIPPNDWATVGARLARCRHAEVTHRGDHFIAWVRLAPDGLLFSKTGKTQLEAIRAAVEAAEKGNTNGY